MTVIQESKIPWYPLTNATVIVPSELSWNSNDPLAITIIFGGNPDKVMWTFARDLLRTALDSGSAGDGDVHAEAKDGTLMLMLQSPQGKIALRTQAAFISAFLGRTYAEVPAGFETDYLHIDQAIRELLG